MNKKKMLRTAARMASPHLATMLGRKRSPLDRAADFGRGLVPARSSSGIGSMALKGLGAAALAVPLGMWLGRRMMDRA